MDYTKTYKKIYSAIKTEHLPHELVHNVSIRIVDAINDLYLYEKKEDLSSLPSVQELIKKFWPTKE
jgi:hypothetical protein